MKVVSFASIATLSVRAAATLAIAILLAGGTAFAGSPPTHRGTGSDPAYARLKPRPLPEGIRIPDYSPGQVPFHRGEQLVYQASWIGIPAAGGRVVLHSDHAEPGLLRAEIWIKTNRLIDVFYRMRDYLRETFGAKSLEPSELYIRQNEGHRHDVFDVTFDHHNSVVTLVKHGPRGVKRREFLSRNPSGPVSAALMALSQPLKVGDSLRFDAFSGTTRYVFNLHVAGRDRIRTPLGDFDAFRIVPSISYLSDGSLNDKAHNTVLWVSADARRLPLRIESTVFIGAVRIDLVKIIDGATSQSAQN
jgi:Protein of unknown function (DUF3108)